MTELMPEVASNVEFLSDETFAYADTLKAKQGSDFLTMAAAQGENQATEQGRHSQKLQDSLTHSDSTVDPIATGQDQTFVDQKQPSNLIFEQEQQEGDAPDSDADDEIQEIEEHKMQ